MKKTKFLALVLVVAIMMMGAGYAAWTETLVINNNLATGNVDIDFTGYGSVKVFATGAVVSGSTGDGLSRGDTWAWGSDQEATIKVTNLYPGAKVVAELPIKNNGSIPVRFKGITTNAPAWLTLSYINPASLAVGGTGNIVVTMLVTTGDLGENVSDIKFTINPIYIQWNAH